MEFINAEGLHIFNDDIYLFKSFKIFHNLRRITQINKIIVTNKLFEGLQVNINCLMKLLY